MKVFSRIAVEVLLGPMLSCRSVTKQSNLTLNHHVRLFDLFFASHSGQIDGFISLGSWINLYLLTGGILTVLFQGGGSFAE